MAKNKKHVNEKWRIRLVGCTLCAAIWALVYFFLVWIFPHTINPDDYTFTVIEKAGFETASYKDNVVVQNHKWGKIAVHVNDEDYARIAEGQTIYARCSHKFIRAVSFNDSRYSFKDVSLSGPEDCIQKEINFFKYFFLFAISTIMICLQCLIFVYTSDGAEYLVYGL